MFLWLEYIRSNIMREFVFCFLVVRSGVLLFLCSSYDHFGMFGLYVWLCRGSLTNPCLEFNKT